MKYVKLTLCIIVLVASVLTLFQLMDPHWTLPAAFGCFIVLNGINGVEECREGKRLEGGVTLLLTALFLVLVIFYFMG